MLLFKRMQASPSLLKHSLEFNFRLGHVGIIIGQRFALLPLQFFYKGPMLPHFAHVRTRGLPLPRLALTDLRTLISSKVHRHLEAGTVVGIRIV